MAQTYTLWRGGRPIQIEKEKEYFTVILPQARMVQEMQRISVVEEIKPVFHHIFKVRTKEEARDDLMEHVRKEMNAQGISHHAYHPVGDAVTRYYLTDQIMVRFQKGVSSSQIERVLERHGLNLMRTYGGDSTTFLLKVTSSAGKNPVKVCNDLVGRAEITWAEPNLINRFAHFYEPQDTLFSRQWHLKSWSGIELIPEADVAAPRAWDLNRGSKNIVVAVIDDGFDILHPDLRDKIVYPKDFVDGDSDPFPSRSRGDFHGTPCAGVALGAENGSGIVGMAPGCSFMPVRFALSADDNLLWEIFDYAGKRADVLSCSWGPVPVYAPLSRLLTDKFSELSRTGGPRGKGCVICFAAGNFNAPVNDPDNVRFEWRHPSYGILNTQGPILNGNAAHPDVIAVSASTSQNRKSAYSNWGKEITVCAPSDNWHPIDPQARMPGRGIWTADNETYGLGYTTNSRYTGHFGGTSSATPLVAGVAALVLSANPELTAAQVRDILSETADKIEDLQADPVLGMQKGTYGGNGHSEWFGHGKVNAFRAVQRALELKGAEEEPEETLTEGIYIAALFPNPKGSDYQKERVILMNATDRKVDLSGWSIKDAYDRVQGLDGISLDSGAFESIKAEAIRLPNIGNNLQLLNPAGVVVQEVSYGPADAAREGWFVKT